MRHKNLEVRRHPLNLTDALVIFGKLKTSHPDDAECREVARVGMRLVREIQHLHGILADVRSKMPPDYSGYSDPARLDTALARTTVYDRGDEPEGQDDAA